MANVKVAVRVRPLSKRESAEGARIIIEVDDKAARIRNQKDHRLEGSWDTRERILEFGFDYCYWSVNPDDPNYASQEVVYQDLGTSVLSGAIKGYNVCLFAYGQTGSGKTYTMMGTPASVGLTPRICEGLFARNHDYSGSPASCRIEVSFLEIYNERVRDLLKQSDRKKPYTLRVREHPEKGPYVQGLSQHIVNDYKQVVEFLEEGLANRITAATHIHDASSRSHAIFTIQYTQAILENTFPSEIASKINLVDLAGSERASPSYCKDRLTEGSNINKSLVTLGIVISTLAQNSQMFSSCQSINTIASDGDSYTPGSHSGGSFGGSRRQSYIPYRDSVLTWLLKDSLGGNSKTIMIATISPASTSYNETVSALRYASNAKNIINKPRVNEDANVKLIRELREEIDRLKTMLISFELRNCSPSFSDDRDGNLTELVLQNELKIEQLTKDWTDKWADRKAIMEEYNVDINKRKASVIIDSSLPHLIAMDDDILSTGVILYHLREGITRIGCNDSNQDQDIVLQGQWMERDHCIIDNKCGIVTLQPIQGAYCTVNGHEVTNSCHLSQGAVVILGKVHKFRFNHPAEAAVLRQRRSNSDASYLRSSSLEWLDLGGDFAPSTFCFLSPLLPARNVDAVHEEYKQKLRDLKTFYQQQVHQQQLYVEDLKQQIFTAQIKAEQELEYDQALINQQIKENRKYLIAEEKRLSSFQQQLRDSAVQTESNSYAEAEVQNTVETESCPFILLQGRKKLVQLELLHRHSLKKAERNVKRKRVKFQLERIVKKQKLLDAKKNLQQLESVCWLSEERLKQTLAQDPNTTLTSLGPRLFRRSKSLDSGSLQSWRLSSNKLLSCFYSEPVPISNAFLKRKDMSELSTSSPTLKHHEVHVPRKSLSIESLSGTTKDILKRENLSLKGNSSSLTQMAKNTNMGTVKNHKRTEKGVHAFCPVIKPDMNKKYKRMDKIDTKSEKNGRMNQITNSSPGQLKKSIGPGSIFEGIRMTKSKALSDSSRYTGRSLKGSNGKAYNRKDPIKYPEKSVMETKKLLRLGKPPSGHLGQTVKALKKEPNSFLTSFHGQSEKQQTFMAASSVEDLKRINVSVPFHHTDKIWHSAEVLSTGISNTATDLLENWQEEDENEISDTDSLYSVDSLSSAYAKALTEQLKQEDLKRNKSILSQEESESDDSQMSQDSLVEKEIKAKKQSKLFLHKLKPLKHPVKDLTDMSVLPDATSYSLGSELAEIERSFSLDSLADVEAALESDSSDEMPAEIFWKLQSPKSPLPESEDPYISKTLQKEPIELANLKHSFYLNRKEEPNSTHTCTSLQKELDICCKENSSFCKSESGNLRETPLILTDPWLFFDSKSKSSNSQGAAPSFPETLEFLEAVLPSVHKLECCKKDKELKQSAVKDSLLFTHQELQSTAQLSCIVRNINRIPSKEIPEELLWETETQSCNNELDRNRISTKTTLLSKNFQEMATCVEYCSQNTPALSLSDSSAGINPKDASDSALSANDDFYEAIQSNTTKYEQHCEFPNSFSVPSTDRIKKVNCLDIAPLGACAPQASCKNETYLSKSTNVATANLPHNMNLTEKNINDVTCEARDETYSRLDSNSFSICKENVLFPVAFEAEPYDANQLPCQKVMEIRAVRKIHKFSEEKNCDLETQCSLKCTNQKKITCKNVSMEDETSIQHGYSETEYRPTTQAREEEDGVVLCLTLNQAISTHPNSTLNDRKIDSRETIDYKKLVASGDVHQERSCNLNNEFVLSKKGVDDVKTKILLPEENIISDQYSKPLNEASHVVGQNNEMLRETTENLRPFEGRKMKLLEMSQIQPQKSLNHVFSNTQDVKIEENIELFNSVNKQTNSLETKSRECGRPDHCFLVAMHSDNVNRDKDSHESTGLTLRAIDFGKTRDCSDKCQLYGMGLTRVLQKESMEIDISAHVSGETEKVESFDSQVSSFIQKQTESKNNINDCFTEIEIHSGSVADTQDSLDSIEVYHESNQNSNSKEDNLLNAETLLIAIPIKHKQEEQLFITNCDKHTISSNENITCMLIGDSVVVPELISLKNNLDSITHSDIIKNDMAYNTVRHERLVYTGTSHLPASDLLHAEELQVQMSHNNETNENILSQCEISDNMFAAARPEDQDPFSANKLCKIKGCIDKNLIIKAIKPPALQIQLDLLSKSANEISNNNFSDDGGRTEQHDDSEAFCGKRASVIENSKISSAIKYTEDIPENLVNTRGSEAGNRYSHCEPVLVQSVDKEETIMVNLGEMDIETVIKKTLETYKESNQRKDVLNKIAKQTERIETENIIVNTNSFKFDNNDGQLDEDLPDKQLAEKSFLYNSSNSASELVASGLQSLPKINENCLSSNDVNSFSEQHLHHDLYLGINNAETVQNNSVTVKDYVKSSNLAGVKKVLPYYETIMENELCADTPDILYREMRPQSDEFVINDKNLSWSLVIHEGPNDEHCLLKNPSETLNNMCSEHSREKNEISSILNNVDCSAAVLDSTCKEIAQNSMHCLKRLSSSEYINQDKKEHACCAKHNREKCVSAVLTMVDLNTMENASSNRDPTGDHLNSFTDGDQVESTVELPSDVSSSIKYKNIPFSRILTNDSDKSRTTFSPELFCNVDGNKCETELYSQALCDSAKEVTTSEFIQSHCEECRALAESREIQISKTSTDNCSIASEEKNNLLETTTQSQQKNAHYNEEFLKYTAVNSGIFELDDCVLNNHAAFEHTHTWKGSEKYEANSLCSKKYNYFESSDITELQNSAVFACQTEDESNCCAFTGKERSSIPELEKKEETPKVIVAADEREELKSTFEEIHGGKKSMQFSGDFVTSAYAKVSEKLSVDIESINLDDNWKQEKNTSDFIEDISLGLKVTAEMEVKEHNYDSGHMNIAYNPLPENHLPSLSVSEKEVDIAHSIFYKAPSPCSESEATYTILKGSTNNINSRKFNSQEDSIALKFGQLSVSLQDISLTDQLSVVRPYHHLVQEKKGKHFKAVSLEDSVNCDATSIHGYPHTSISSHQMPPSVQTQGVLSENIVIYDLQPLQPHNLLPAANGSRHNFKSDITETEKACKEDSAIDTTLTQENNLGLLNLIEEIDKKQREPHQLSGACLEIHQKKIQKDKKEHNSTEITSRNKTLLSSIISENALLEENKEQTDLPAGKNNDCNELIELNSVDQFTDPQLTVLQTIDVENVNVEMTCFQDVDVLALTKDDTADLEKIHHKHSSHKTQLLTGLKTDGRSQYISGMYQSETPVAQNPRTRVEITNITNDTHSNAESSAIETVNNDQKDNDIMKEKILGSERLSLNNISSHVLIENKCLHPQVKYRNKKSLVSAHHIDNFYKNEYSSCLQNHRLSAPSISVMSKSEDSLAARERTNPVFTSSKSLQQLNMSVEPPSPTEDSDLYSIENDSKLGPNNCADSKPNIRIQMKSLHSDRAENTSLQHFSEGPDVSQSFESFAVLHASSLSDIIDSSMKIERNSYSNDTDPSKCLEGIYEEFKYQSVEINHCLQDNKELMHFSSSDINPYVHPWQEDDHCRVGWKQYGFGSASDVSCNQLQLSFDDHKVMRCSSVDNGLNAQNSPFHSHLSSYANARVISSTLSSIENLQVLDDITQELESAYSPDCATYCYPIYDEAVRTKLEQRESQFENISSQLGNHPMQVDEIVLLYPSESESSSEKTQMTTCEQSTQTVTKTRHKRVNKHQSCYTDVNTAKQETSRRKVQRQASWTSRHNLSLHLSQLLHDTSELLSNLSQHRIMDLPLNANNKQRVITKGTIRNAISNISTQTMVDKGIQTDFSEGPKSRDQESQQTKKENDCMNAQEVNVIVKVLGSDIVDVSQESKEVMLILKDSRPPPRTELKIQSMPNISDCDQHKIMQESLITPPNLVKTSMPFLESFQEIPLNAHHIDLFSPRVSSVVFPSSEQIESSCTSVPRTHQFEQTQTEQKKDQSNDIKKERRLYYKNTLLVDRASSPILTLSASLDNQISSRSSSYTKQQNNAVKSLSKEVSDFCQGFSIQEPSMDNSSQTESDTEFDSCHGSKEVFKKSGNLSSRNTAKNLLGKGGSKESKLKFRFQNNSSANDINSKKCSNSDCTSQALYHREGKMFNIPAHHSLQDQSASKRENENSGEKRHNKFDGLADGLSIRQHHENSAHTWEHPSSFENLSHASSNEELITDSIINLTERDGETMSLKYLLANPSIPGNPSAWKNPNYSFSTSEMSEMTIHLPDEDAVSIIASEANTEILLNENPSLVMNHRPQSYSLRDLPLHNKFRNWSGVQCNAQSPNDVMSSFADLQNEAQQERVKDHASETEGKAQLSENKTREIERLQRERAQIMSSINLDMNQHPLTVELTEAKLNYGIGETDALLRILKDGTRKDGTMFFTKQQLYERHMKVIEKLRKEREEKLQCFRRSRSLSPEKHFRLSQASCPTPRDLDLPSRRREYLQQLRKDVVDNTRVQEPKTRAAQHPSEIELLLRDYQRAREEAKTEIARARDKLRERAEQEKKRLHQQMISHLLKEEAKMKTLLSTSTLCTSSSLSLSSSPTSGYNSSNTAIYGANQQEGQYQNTPRSTEHSKGDTRGRSTVRNSQLYMSEQSLNNSAGDFFSTTFTTTGVSRRIKPTLQSSIGHRSSHGLNCSFSSLQSFPSATYQDLSKHILANATAEVMAACSNDLGNLFKCQAAAGWKYHCMEKEVQIYYKAFSSITKHGFLGAGVIEKPLNNVWSMVRDPTKRSLYDKTITTVRVHKKVCNDVQLVYLVSNTSLCYLKQPRDFCCMSVEAKEEKWFIASFQSVYDESMPRPCKDIIRGELLPSAWILQPDTLNGKDITRVVYLVQVDFGAPALPSRLLGSIAKRPPLVITSLASFLSS
ncbi:stAR-related lipid transfer protein 9 [Rhinatrema bivittatum]|uniref:stAR-related lipid transfer protein 9 n=1 Tax=Rhinatrema bivittatum TaxID=194408 RepID=UPI00112C18E3|nr:stAR-related lipid transfer protein 9 [Rhinatrema bivittatum]